MKSLFVKKHLFLLLATVFFCLSLISWYFLVFKSNKSNDQRSVQNITRKVNTELSNVAEQSALIRKQILTTDNISFSSTIIPAKYPYFVFRNEQLFFWSDNSFMPFYEMIKGKFTNRFIQLKNGKYILYKERFTKNNEAFDVAVFLPLSYEYSVQNNYISSGLNENIFSSFPFKINSNYSKFGNNILTKSGEFLFALEVPKEHDYRNEGQMLFLILLIALGIVFFFLYVLDWVLILQKEKKIGLSIILMGAGLIAVRTGMLLFNYPFSLYEYDLFDSKYFASSSMSPSLGDVLLNTMAIILFSSYLFKHYKHTKLFKRLVKARGNFKVVLSVFVAGLSFFALYLVYYILGILSYHSQWSLDITSDLDFNVFRIISLVLFICIFVVYFLHSHILLRFFISLNSDSDRKNLITFFIGAILFVLFSYLFSELLWFIVIVNTCYFLILYYLNLPRTVSSLKYSTYLYYLACAFVCSITGAYSIYRQNLSKTIYDKQHYASTLIFKNDVFGEFLLNEASVKVKRDQFILGRLMTPLSSKELIEQKIKRVFLSDNNFDKYDIVVSVFDNNGNVYEKNSDYTTYSEAQRKYIKNKFKTEYNQIYFISDPETGSRKYMCFNEIHKDDVLIGYIIIELKYKKVIAHSVYPELIIDNYSERSHEPRSYNYAVFSELKPLYSFGNYNYSIDFDNNWLKDEDLYSEGVVGSDYHHIGLRMQDGKTIVVSSEKYTFTRIFSNFSFFFLILILFTLVFIVIFALNFQSGNTMTYATKIQIYLNIAFFLPLLIVSITTLSIISASYKDNLNNSFIKKADDIGINISGFLQKDRMSENQMERLENSMTQITKYTEADINLFNSNGKLIFTNQPLIYDLGFLSKVINPQAYASMVEHSGSNLMVSEKIGKLKYNSVYVAIRSSENNDLLGILSMPFFESKNELDKQIIHVLTTIVNIFVSIFIMFLVLSYFASHVLTVPLKIITQKLKKTTLEKNEPIEWRTNDEIGLLVGEYNSMLVKLEESKEALTRGEKESAWREMAKQVAHEIKNPLTPMKLTIQHLQRAVENKDEEIPEKTKKALTVLLDQVNNLSEIATSFSMFAKMPIPKTQRFEISSVLLKTAALHNNNKEVIVETQVEPGEYYVMGDEQLMSGIFTNLILNGVQSVPNKRTAIIQVKLTTSDLKVLIEVKDNGTGIPASIKDKVFLPNFSTKFAGSGIGLAVAKRGVEHAGGRIWFETTEGEGTSFFIEIPLTD